MKEKYIMMKDKLRRFFKMVEMNIEDKKTMDFKKKTPLANENQEYIHDKANLKKKKEKMMMTMMKQKFK
jgi:hypothetical protein